MSVVDTEEPKCNICATNNEENQATTCLCDFCNEKSYACIMHKSRLVMEVYVKQKKEWIHLCKRCMEKLAERLNKHRYKIMKYLYEDVADRPCMRNVQHVCDFCCYANWFYVDQNGDDFYTLKVYVAKYDQELDMCKFCFDTFVKRNSAHCIQMMRYLC